MFWWIVGAAVFVAMGLLAAALAMVSDGIAARKRFDLELARYTPKHTATMPRSGEPDPWATILRAPAPGRDPKPATVQFRALTDTGAHRALIAETEAWIAKNCPGEGT